MSVIYGILAMTWGGYVAQPQWFDNGPYEYDKQYETLAECKIAKHGTDDICVGEQPSDRYVKNNIEFSVYDTDHSALSKELEFVECDYWAGCYWGKR